MRGNSPDSPARLLPIHGVTGCVGHILRTAKGFRAFDSQDKEVGTFDSAEAGAAALLELTVIAEVA